MNSRPLTLESSNALLETGDDWSAPMYRMNHETSATDVVTWEYEESYTVSKHDSASQEAIATPTTCSTQKINEVLAPASETTPAVNIDCHLNLKSSDVVTKRIILTGASATGVTVDCNFATLNGGEGTINYDEDMNEIRSRKYKDTAQGTWKWERPESITIKNCNVIGSIRVRGMATDDLRESSRSSEHVTTARNNAPKKVIFDNITITGVGKIPLYFASGVTYSELINSEIKGVSRSVAVYLDAESYNNIFKNNYIHAVTIEREREVMAIDGSSYNKIVNNKFSALNNGGIYLYRNCGERGVIRHSTPSHNTIVNNIFYYDKYKGGNPSIFLGARNGNKSYCNEDKGYPYGSSKSDLDSATYNIVMQNQIYKRSISDMIKSKNWKNNSPNYIAYNETVTTETKRLAGCYVSPNLYERDFVLHGESFYVLEIRNSEPACYQYTCTDGDLSYSSCNASKSSFDCHVSESNSGCHKIVYCPSGQKIIGATAACNLEYGTISDEVLATVPTNTIRVIKASDHVSDGSCYVGGNSLQSGEKTIIGIDGLDRVSVGCKEHDRNGGDCHIKGILYCR
jgi:hypothetical protein